MQPLLRPTPAIRALLLVAGLLLVACDDSAEPVALEDGSGGVDHSKHDCTTAHPRELPVEAPQYVALSKDASRRLTRLRISSHQSSVTLRKTPLGWEIGGHDGCVVPKKPVQAALDTLMQLKSRPTDKQPTSGQDFQLSVIAHADIDPVFHMDVAGPEGDEQLVQMGDLSTHLVRELKLEALSPRVETWCAQRAQLESPSGG